MYICLIDNRECFEKDLIVDVIFFNVFILIFLEFVVKYFYECGIEMFFENFDFDMGRIILLFFGVK